MPLKPLKHQEEAIRRAIKHNLLVAYPTGSGKTITGIEIARRFNIPPRLVICNKRARLQWAEVIREQVPSAQVVIADRYTDIDPPGPFAQELRHYWAVIHYEALLPLLLKENNKAPILRTRWGSVICDEAHKIKNRHAKRTKAVKALDAIRKVALTATEMESDPSDMWSILNWLDPRSWKAYHAFRARYTQVIVTPQGYEIVTGAQNLPELGERLRKSRLYVHKTKEEVMGSLPPLTETYTPVPLSPKLARLYRTVEEADDILVDLGPGDIVQAVPNVLSRITLLRRVLSEGRPEQSIDSEKQLWVQDYIADNPTENVLIFTTFRRTAQALAKSLDCPLIIGGAPLPDLTTKPQVLVATIDAGGESLDLPWYTTAIFVDQHWSSTKMDQAKNRIHRLSSVGARQVIYLYHPKTVDALVARALQHKLSVIDMVHAYIRGERELT